MLQVGSVLKGYGIEATDGTIGTVSDFLFDDRTWKIRWLVVDSGNWLTGRLVLLHPSAIGRADAVERVLAVRLTKAQVKSSPDIFQDRPVSRQNEFNLYDYYGWDPVWGTSYFGPATTAPDAADQAVAEAGVLSHLEGNDPHLRSLSDVSGYDIEASDGAIGHLQNVVIDDAGLGYPLPDYRHQKLVAGPARAVVALCGARHQLGNRPDFSGCLA